MCAVQPFCVLFLPNIGQKGPKKGKSMLGMSENLSFSSFFGEKGRNCGAF